MPVSTFYPNANPETVSFDGYIMRGSVNETFATIRAGTGTASGDLDTDAYLYLACSTTTDQFGDMRRFILLFDTSALGSGATITAATLSFWCLAKANTIGSPDIHAVSSNPVSNTAIVDNNDYATIGSTSFGSVAYASVSVAGAYTDITLNASGLAAISGTGITKLGLRQSWDQSGTFGGTWIGNNASYFQINMAENASGTARAPKLVVTYTVTGSAVLTGTMVGGITETDVVSGGKVLTISLTGDTFIA